MFPDTHQRPAKLTREQIVLLRCAQAKIGDLKIGNQYQSWQIDSFPIPGEEEHGT
jgi:hypothetical protein